MASEGSSETLKNIKHNVNFHSHEDINFFFCPMPPHDLVDFVVLPPVHGRSVTDF